MFYPNEYRRVLLPPGAEPPRTRCRTLPLITAGAALPGAGAPPPAGGRRSGRRERTSRRAARASGTKPEGAEDRCSPTFFQVLVRNLRFSWALADRRSRRPAAVARPRADGGGQRTVNGRRKTVDGWISASPFTIHDSGPSRIPH